MCGKGRRINVTLSVLWFKTLFITSHLGLWDSLHKEGFRVSFKAICNFSVRAARLQLECRIPNYLSLVNYNRLTHWQSQIEINALVARLSCLKWVLPSALVFSADTSELAAALQCFPRLLSLWKDLLSSSFALQAPPAPLGHLPGCTLLVLPACLPHPFSTSSWQFDVSSAFWAAEVIPLPKRFCLSRAPTTKKETHLSPCCSVTAL